MRALAARALDLRRPRADLARAQHARARRRPSARWRPGGRRARRTRARTCARPGARDGPRRPRPRARRRASRARGGAAAARSGAPSRPCRSPAAPATRAPRARRPGAARARRRPRCGRRARARAAAWRRCGSTSSGAGAASTIACEMPVKRWMPRPSGLATPTSESHSSCSSPPPTSTVPTSVSSQRSPAKPFVSVSSATNSVVANACSSMDPAASRVVRTVQRRLRARRALPFALVRRLALIALVVMAGCGGSEPRENDLRPPVPVLMTAAIQDDVVRVSPTSVGAGQVTLVVSNQTDQPQTVTFETDELGASSAGNRASSREIAPQGHWPAHDRRCARAPTPSTPPTRRSAGPGSVIGPPRESGQDRVLLP